MNERTTVNWCVRDQVDSDMQPNMQGRRFDPTLHRHPQASQFRVLSMRMSSLTMLLPQVQSISVFPIVLKYLEKSMAPNVENRNHRKHEQAPIP